MKYSGFSFSLTNLHKLEICISCSGIYGNNICYVTTDDSFFHVMVVGLWTLLLGLQLFLLVFEKLSGDILNEMPPAC